MKPSELFDIISDNYDELFIYAAECDAISEGTREGDTTLSDTNAWSVIRDALTRLESLDK